MSSLWVGPQRMNASMQYADQLTEWRLRVDRNLFPSKPRLTPCPGRRLTPGNCRRQLSTVADTFNNGTNSLSLAFAVSCPVYNVKCITISYLLTFPTAVLLSHDNDISISCRCGVSVILTSSTNFMATYTGRVNI